MLAFVNMLRGENNNVQSAVKYHDV